MNKSIALAMQKRIQKILMVLATLGLLITFLVNFDFISGGLSPRIEGNTLVLGIALDYPPYEFTRQGLPVGYSVDLANILAEKMNVKISIKDMDFNSLIPALRGEQVDFAISSIAATKERGKYIDFTRPYYTSKAEIVTLKKKNIDNLSQLDNSRIGVQMGSSFPTYLKKRFQNANRVEFMDISSLVGELEAGNLDAIILDMGIARRVINDINNFKIIRVDDFEEKNAIALPKNSALVKKFNQAIATLEKEGTLKKLEEKWNISNND